MVDGRREGFDECSMCSGARGAREKSWIMAWKNMMNWTDESRHDLGEKGIVYQEWR